MTYLLLLATYVATASLLLFDKWLDKGYISIKHLIQSLILAAIPIVGILVAIIEFLVLIGNSVVWVKLDNKVIFGRKQ